MGWAYGKIGEKEIGYSVEATCEHPECDAKIDRGLAFACGGQHGTRDGSCLGYFCDEHLDFPALDEDHPRMCGACCTILETELTACDSCGDYVARDQLRFGECVDCSH